MIIPHPCNNCQREFMVDTRELNRGNGKYCGRACSGEALARKRVEERGDDWQNGFCAYCAEPLHITEQRRKNSKSGLYFCSRSHQALAFSDKNIPVKPGPKGDPRRRICPTDGCTTKTENPLCQKCTTQSKIDAWLGGDITASWVSTTREPRPFVKRYLIRTRGDSCEICGFSEKATDGSSVIQMDHIDGDYTNNLLSNLRLLCPNHHAMTATYGSKNTKGGRRYRLANVPRYK